MTRRLRLVLLVGLLLLSTTAPSLSVRRPNTTQVIAFTTYADGRVLVDRGGIAASGQGHAVKVGGDPRDAIDEVTACQDSAYTLASPSYKERGTFSFYYNAGSAPAGLTFHESEVLEAADNVTSAWNNCGLADPVTAESSYAGTSGTAANINNSGTCGANDSTSVVSWGDLPLGTLARTCVWVDASYNPYELTHADTKINKVDYEWTTGPAVTCTGDPSLLDEKFVLEAVLTHEFGHVFGLGHVSEANHGSLTMSTQIPPCSSSARTLGKGDVLGLDALY